MVVPLWLHPGTSELDNVPYIKTPGPGTYWYREYRTRQQERRSSCCSLWVAALLRLQENFLENVPF